MLYFPDIYHLNISLTSQHIILRFISILGSWKGVSKDTISMFPSECWWYTLPEPFQLDEFESDSDSDSNEAESEEIVEESHKKIGETDKSIDEI